MEPWEWKCKRHNILGTGPKWCFLCQDEKKELEMRRFSESLDKHVKRKNKK